MVTRIAVFFFLGWSLFVLESADSARHVRERLQIVEPTGEANPKLEHIEFDPLIAELEQEEDDRKWLDKHKNVHRRLGHVHPGGVQDGGADMTIEGAQFEEAEEDIESEFVLPGLDADLADVEDLEEQFRTGMLDDESFNITARLIQLFPLIDVSPADGKASVDELTAWHIHLEKQASLHRSQREMEAADADTDGTATLQEALSELGVGDPENPANQEQRDVLTSRFHLADSNNDSVLNLTEFNDFLHPEESANPGLRRSLLLEEMRHRDLDGDGRIGLSEFEHTTYHELKHRTDAHLDPVESARAHLSSPDHHDPRRAPRVREETVEAKFKEIDGDNDGYISPDEFESVMKVLWPGQEEFAREHSAEIVREADGDGDGALRLDEMLKHPHVFYHTASEPEQPTAVHDEF